MTAAAVSEPQPCRLGYVEQDGYRYCFAHSDFVHEYANTSQTCPTAQAAWSGWLVEQGARP